MLAGPAPVPTEVELDNLLDFFATGNKHYEHWSTPDLEEILDRVYQTKTLTEEDREEAQAIRDQAETEENIAESEGA